MLLDPALITGNYPENGSKSSQLQQKCSHLSGVHHALEVNYALRQKSLHSGGVHCALHVASVRTATQGI